MAIDNWESPVLAVQWHPEELRDLNLIKNFFGRNCRKKKPRAAANTAKS